MRASPGDPQNLSICIAVMLQFAGVDAVWFQKTSLIGGDFSGTQAAHLAAPCST
jgi:hypothetical protein